MLIVYIDNVDRTGDLEYGTLKISNAIQQRSDVCNFNLFSGDRPVENDDLRVYRYDTIAGIAGVTLTLDGNFQFNTNYFFSGQELRIRIGDADEETVIIDTYDEATLQLVLVAAPSGTVSIGDKVGVIIFGGVISRAKDNNIVVLQNLEFPTEGVDYTKIFNKKLINDTWENRDSRYIINSAVNSTINFNRTIDDMDYANNTAIQAAWTEGGDGDNPTVDSTDPLEGDNSADFSWTNSSGTATFVATPSAQDFSEFTGASSGAPSEGDFMLWIKTSDVANITSIAVRFGSSASDYIEVDIDLPTTTDFEYKRVKLINGSVTGTPDWTALDYVQVRILQTGNGTILLNGLRINKEDSFTLFNVEPTPVFDDFRAPFKQPTSLMQLLAKTWAYVWYIDYLRDIRFVDEEAEPSPLIVSDTSNNFTDLKTKVDESSVGNRIVVQGGETISSSPYAQVEPGDSTRREWLVKNKFRNMSLSIDDGSSTDLMEATTTTTTVKATAHGLVVGDHMVNRSQANEVRQVLTVPDLDTFTVEAVAGQGSGDTFSKFDTPKTIGNEGETDEATVDYVGNSNEKSVRATDSENTLDPGDFIRFEYNERIPIQYQYTDTVSADALKARGIGDGIFDLDKFTDENIDSQALAIAIAQAKVAVFSNPIISGFYNTDQNGFKAGQIVTINETNRSAEVLGDYVIQTVSITQKAGEFADYFTYKVNYGTTLFGVMEFFQKLLATKDRLRINVDAIISTFVTANEEVDCSDVNAVAKDGGFKSVKVAETVESSDVNTVDTLASGTWQFEPSIGQTFPTRFDLADFG